jgi:dipeptidyl aminopeptidase/acylaminoacyl peptidase
MAPLIPACGATGGGDTPLEIDSGTTGEVFDDSRPTIGEITVEPKTASLTVALGAIGTQTYQAFATKDGVKTEVTDKCGWTVGDPSFGSFAGAKMAVAARGGETTITATCSGASGSSALTVKVTGSLKSPDAPTNSADLFATAKLGSDAARKPAIEYPVDSAVAPLNIPSVDAQWTKAGSDLFHLQLASTYLTVDYYTKGDDAALAEADWRSVARTAAGDTLTFSVEGLTIATPGDKFKSALVALRMSNDVIDNTAIYYWASSKGDLMTQTFGTTTAPSSVRGDCTSCHSVSRAGPRVGYSRCVGGKCDGTFIGFMKYDATSKTWKDTLDANGKKVQGSYTTFSPVGYPFKTDDQSLALASLAGGKLELFDPDTGTVVPSNVGDVSSSGGKASALMADWSPDGKTIVFTTTPTPGQSIDLAKGALATMTFTSDGKTHTFGAPKKIVEGPITLPSGSYDNLFFPSWSADGKLIVFNAARMQWRAFDDASKPGQRLMLTDATGSFKTELAKLNGEGDHNVTWPHWAPATSKDYYWVVYSAERDYGHKLTAGNTAAACKANGVKQCKQIWIGAIDKSKVGAGDPSAPPMWMPGQDIGADNISPYWTLPASGVAK